MTAHFMQIYESDAFLVEQVANFLRSGIRDGEAAVVIATALHRIGIKDRLRQDERVSKVMSGDATACTFLDATQVQTHFMHDGWPDAQQFLSYFSEAIRTASDDGRRQVRLFGEIVAVLVDADRVEAAVRLEDLWNELAHTQSFTLFCAYPMHSVPKMAGRLMYVCAAHSRLTMPAHLRADAALGV